MTPVDGREQVLFDLEEARCRAVSSGDITALSPLLGDELTHTHAAGRTEGKEEYLDRLAAGDARVTTRSGLTVRFYGEVAVMTGTLRNEFPDVTPPEVVELQALQIWAERGGSWVQVAFSASGRGRTRR